MSFRWVGSKVTKIQVESNETAAFRKADRNKFSVWGTSQSLFRNGHCVETC